MQANQDANDIWKDSKCKMRSIIREGLRCDITYEPGLKGWPGLQEE